MIHDNSHEIMYYIYSSTLDGFISINWSTTLVIGRSYTYTMKQHITVVIIIISASLTKCFWFHYINSSLKGGTVMAFTLVRMTRFFTPSITYLELEWTNWENIVLWLGEGGQCEYVWHDYHTRVARLSTKAIIWTHSPIHSVCQPY